MNKTEALKLALEVYRGELCYKSQEDDQSFGMWCPVTEDLPFPEGTKFYTTPPQRKPLTEDEILAEQAEKKKMPITDDHGKAIHDQRRVVEQKGNWQLIYNQHQIGNKVVHEFRIQKLRHDIVLYPGITLEEAKQRFSEKVEADNE